MLSEELHLIILNRACFSASGQAFSPSDVEQTLRGQRAMNPILQTSQIKRNNNMILFFSSFLFLPAVEMIWKAEVTERS